jgi:glutathione synthase/RimK-type ligase-like ATP-grasp enzyme
MKIAIATSSQYPNLCDDDSPLIESFAQGNVEAVPAVWGDASIDWSGFDAVVIRSTWDYHLRTDAFLHWVDAVARKTRVLNDPEMMRWNAHKGYLLELAEQGISIIPTALLERGQQASIDELAVALCAEELVVKPAVGAASHGLMFVAAGHSSREEAQAVLVAESAQREMLIQPFLREIYDQRERSLMYFNGKYSHAVTRPAQTPGIATDVHRGEPYDPTKEERSMSERSLAVLSTVPMYARVDLIPFEGESRLSELELIEPGLYLRDDPGSFDRFVDAFLYTTR